MMRAFWRKEPLTAGEEKLLLAVLQAHHASAGRNNVSSQAVGIGAIAANDYGKAIAGAIMTLGGVHGPIEAAVRLLEAPDVAREVRARLGARQRVPGFGNSFHRGEMDPLWRDVATLIAVTDAGAQLAHAQRALREAGKDLYPNPAGYTAAAAMAVGMPAAVAPFLFLSGRLEAWTEIYLNNRLTNLWEH